MSHLLTSYTRSNLHPTYYLEFACEPDSESSSSDWTVPNAEDGLLSFPFQEPITITIHVPESNINFPTARSCVGPRRRLSQPARGPGGMMDRQSSPHPPRLSWHVISAVFCAWVSTQRIAGIQIQKISGSQLAWFVTVLCS